MSFFIGQILPPLGLEPETSHNPSPSLLPFEQGLKGNMICNILQLIKLHNLG